MGAFSWRPIYKSHEPGEIAMNKQTLNAIDAVKVLMRPFIPPSLLRARAERNFFLERSWYAKHLGAFPSFISANQYLSEKNIQGNGYVLDHESWLKERIKLSSHDYPPLFWISKLIAQNKLRSIIDFGGSVGVSYYAFKDYIEIPADLSWTVCELPEAAEMGAKIAKEKGESQLSFVSDPTVISGASIFYAAGVLHYLDKTLAQLLVENNANPDYLIINKLPLSSRESFVAIEGGGNGFYPCRIQCVSSFIREMRSIGYDVIDRWKCLEHRMDVILRPDLSFPHYQGFVLVKK